MVNSPVLEVFGQVVHDELADEGLGAAAALALRPSRLRVQPRVGPAELGGEGTARRGLLLFPFRRGAVGEPE